MKTCVCFMGLAALLVCLLGGGQAKVTDCNSHFQCADSEMCVEGKCGDPCQAWGCGANTECRTTNHFKPTCHCKPGYIRSNESDVTSACVGPRVKSAELSVDLEDKDGRMWDGLVREASFTVHTREMLVELTRLVCFVRANRGYLVHIAITSQSENITLTHFAHGSSLFSLDYIPVSTQENAVVLSPHTLYTITMTSYVEFKLLSFPSPRYEESHFKLQFPPQGSRYSSPIYAIYYKTLTFS